MGLLPLFQSWREAGRSFVLSPPFQSAAQNSFGVLLCCLLVFVRPLTFHLSCLASLLLVVVLAVLAPDNHLGTRLLAAATLMGAMAWGLVLAGCVLSLAHLVVMPYCGGTAVSCAPHTALLVLLGAAVLGVLAGVRCALGPPHPPLLWVAGMVATLACGLLLVAGQFREDIGVLWSLDVGGLLLASAAASVLSVVSCLAVLPSLALDELRADAAAAIRGIGLAASRFASRALEPEAPPTAVAAAAAAAAATLANTLNTLSRPAAATAIHDDALPHQHHPQMPSATLTIRRPPSPPPSRPLRRQPGITSAAALDQYCDQVAIAIIPTGEVGVGVPATPSSPGPGPGPSSAPASPYISDDDERWSRRQSRGLLYDNSNKDLFGPFEHIMEDEDAFLRMLQEATAPQHLSYRNARGGSGGGGDSGATGSGRRKHQRVRATAPPMVAPPGGILPSPSTQDLTGLGSVTASAAVFVTTSAAVARIGGGKTQGGDGGGGGGAGGGGGDGVSGSQGGGGDGGHTGGHGGSGGLGGSAWMPVSVLRPLLARARACAGAAAVEPPWLINGPADLGCWSRVLEACEVAVQRVAALECLLEDRKGGQPHHHALGDARLAALLGRDIIAPYRRVYGDVAASCAALSAAVVAAAAGPSVSWFCSSSGKKSPPSPPLGVGSWHNDRLALHALVRDTLRDYWARVRAAGGGPTGGAAQEGAGEHALSRAATTIDNPQPHLHLRTPLHLRFNSDRRLRLAPPPSAPHPSPPHPSNMLSGCTEEGPREVTALQPQPPSHNHLQPPHQQHLKAPWAVAEGQEGGLEVPHVVAGAAAPPLPPAESPSPALGVQQKEQQLRHSLSCFLPATGRSTGPPQGPPPLGPPLPLALPLAARLPRSVRGVRVRILSLTQARALTFLWTVTEGVMSAMDELESAVRQALAVPPYCTADPDTAKVAATAATAPHPTSPPSLGAQVAAAVAAAPAAPGEAGSPTCGPDRGGDNGRGGGDGSGNEGSDDGANGDDFNGVRVRVRSDVNLHGEASAKGECAKEGELGGDPGATKHTCGSPPQPPNPPVGVRVETRTGQPAPQLAAAAGAAGVAAPTGEGKSASGGGWWGRMAASWTWAVPLVKLTLGLPMIQHIPTVTASTATALLTGGPTGRSALLSRRTAQFGAKYWVGGCGVLAVIVELAAQPGALGEVLRRYPLMYAFIATAVSMTDRVESTLSRAALRACGTVLGGAAGMAVLVAPHGLSHNPVAISVVVAGVTFLSCLFFGQRFVYGVTLAQLTFQSIVLCQYGTSCCHTYGSTGEMIVTRVASVLLGCLLPVLLTQAVLPWYTSDWALETMAATCRSAATLVRQLYDNFYQDNLRAHLSSRGLAATCELLRQYGHTAEAEALEAEEKERVEQEEEKKEKREAAAAEEMKREAVPGGVCVVLDESSSGVLPQRGATVRGSSNGGVGGGVGGDGGSISEGGAEEGSNASLPPTRPPHADSAESGKGSGGGGGGGGGGGVADGGDGSGKGAATAPSTPPPSLLRSSILVPLVGVQASLMKDVTVWSRGIYATPPMVPAVLRCCLLLADRLTALQLVVADTPPPVYGSLSGGGFARNVLPLHREMQGMLTVLDRLMDITARRLEPGGSGSGRGGSGRGSMEGGASDRSWGKGMGSEGGEGGEVVGGGDWELQAAVRDLDQMRLQLRQHYHDMRRAFYAAVRCIEESHLSYTTHPDDSVASNSMLYALVKVLDSATATARTVLEMKRDKGRVGWGA